MSSCSRGNPPTTRLITSPFCGLGWPSNWMRHCGNLLLFHRHCLWSNLQLLRQRRLLRSNRLQQWKHRGCGDKNRWVGHFGKNLLFNFPWFSMGRIILQLFMFVCLFFGFRRHLKDNYIIYQFKSTKHYWVRTKFEKN